MEKKNCYALFIGINKYEHPNISNLRGCVKDATSFLNYIQNNLNDKAYNLQVETLFTGTDQLPTRQNIINKIINHLGQAKHGDKALLFYAGHGSKEKAHPTFKEADGNLQTLVPCDSRMKTDAFEGHLVKNILDKEIRFLFHNLWAAENQKPDLIFIQDSCHSTGATRMDEQLVQVTKALVAVETQLAEENETEVEVTPPVARFTDPSEYEKSGRAWEQLDLPKLALSYTAFRKDEATLGKIVGQLKSGNLSFDENIPLTQHIHFAACDKHQYAYELPGVGGIFTSGMLEILAASQNTISYHDLFNRIRLNIAGVYDQTPDLFVHNADFRKRHEVFLGGLLQHGELAPYREVDVFKGFSPVVTKGRSGWQIKAGEIDLLPNLNGQIKEIPIEVFPQDQQPKGLSNAVINYVATSYSNVEFTTANFDRRTYKNKLYAMIPPHYLRRWRVPVTVETKAAESPFKKLFDHHHLAKEIGKNKLGRRCPIFEPTEDQAAAEYIIKEQDSWFYLYNNKNELIFQTSAAEYTNSYDMKLFRSVIKRPNDEQIYKVHKGKETLLEDAYELKPSTKEAIDLIMAYFIQVFEENRMQRMAGIQFYSGAATGENAFVKFQEAEKNTLNYYAPFINWNAEQPEYKVVSHNDGFAVYPVGNDEAAEVPVFKKTDGLTTNNGYQIILSLQKMSKWRTVLKLNNKLQLNTLAAHKFEFHFKLYSVAVTSRNAENPHTKVVFESWNDKHYSNMESGLVKSLNILQQEQTAVEGLHFIQNPNQDVVVQLDYDLDIVHLQGKQNVYVSTLLLDSNFGISPLQIDMGNNLLPPKGSGDSSRGTLNLPYLNIPKPEQMKNYPRAIKEATFYLKIFIAYRRFDISGLLQEALPPAAKKSDEQSKAKGPKRVTKPPKPEDTGSWMAFTIPITIE